jgi:cysteinyl-tRNA synthetase
MAKDGKMSKSAGDSLTVPYIKKLGYDPMNFRYMILLGHYRQPIEFSFSSLDAARNGYERIVRKINELISENSESKINQQKFDEWKEKILEPVNDNLKTATAIVNFQEMLKDDSTDSVTKLQIVKFTDDLLGLDFMNHAIKMKTENNSVPDEITKLADDRVVAKKNKDFATADKIRLQVDSMGWTIMDSKDGYIIVKK